MKAWIRLAIVATIICTARVGGGVEPNQSFATATVLSPGVLLVSDQLTPGQVQNPDTLLGIRNGSGVVTIVDDNGSMAGNGKASGVQNAPTNGTSLAFTVTGVGDSGFTGNHTQAGRYDVLVDVFSSTGSPLASITDSRTLQAGQVNQFSFSGSSAWNGGRYNINIDNLVTVPVGGDVDYFTFTGLTPGATFVAQTYDPASNVNTLMYWFNSSGSVLDTDDNEGVGNYSLISNVVPSNGRLTFAVTGFGDFIAGAPGGEHTQSGTYQLRVTFPSNLSADFNASHTVDLADLNVWKSSYRTTIAGDADLDFDTDGHDFMLWQRQVGQPGAAIAAQAVPEPGIAALCGAAGLFALQLARRRGTAGLALHATPVGAERHDAKTS